MNVFVLTLLSALLAACRFGGSDASAFELEELASDAALDAEAGAPSEQAEEDANVRPRELDASADARREEPEQDSGSDARADDVCVAPGDVAVCNPVARTGCVFSQCVVDRTKALTGRCVLGTGSAPSGCTESDLATSCPAGSGCYDNVCKALCFCNADCPSGECCSAAAQSDGSRAIGRCQACP